MRIFHEVLRHPTQASSVSVNVYEHESGGFLLTEDRTGTRTVVATLGVVDGREAALLRARARVEELQAQRYRPVAPAA